MNICVILGCRKNYYGRIFQKVSFTEVYEMENWERNQIEKYVNNYLEFAKRVLYHEILRNKIVKAFW